MENPFQTLKKIQRHVLLLIFSLILLSHILLFFEFQLLVVVSKLDSSCIQNIPTQNFPTQTYPTQKSKWIFSPSQLKLGAAFRFPNRVTFGRRLRGISVSKAALHLRKNRRNRQHQDAPGGVVWKHPKG